jgi:1-deoxy-D-xylulose-5-phosphate reductoisomerase
VAVEAFLQGRIRFPVIAEVVEETLTRQSWREPATIEEVIAIDQESRLLAGRIVDEPRPATISV